MPHRDVTGYCVVLWQGKGLDSLNGPFANHADAEAWAKATLSDHKKRTRADVKPIWAAECVYDDETGKLTFDLLGLCESALYWFTHMRLRLEELGEKQSGDLHWVEADLREAVSKITTPARQQVRHANS